MPERDWRDFTPLAVGLILVAGLALLPLADAPFRHQRPDTARIIPSPDSTTDPAAANSPQANPDSQPVDANLRAQESMALATWVQAGVEMFSLFGLFLTVLSARHAWRESKRAADEASRAANISESQVRAYVKPISATIRAGWSSSTISNDFGYVRVAIENLGDTPCSDIKGYAELSVWGEDGRTTTIRLGQGGQFTTGALAAHSNGEVGFLIGTRDFDDKNPRLPDGTGNELPPPADHKRNASCRGTISYTDVFGVRFESEFRFGFRGFPNAFQDVPMVNYGNHSRLFRRVDKNAPARPTQAGVIERQG